MVSKNNMGLLDEKNVDKKQRFSLRKFSVGVASVLIGTTFMATGQKALADPNSSTNQGAVEENTDQQPLASKGQVPLQQKQPTQQSTASQSESSPTTNTLNTATVGNQAAAAPNLSEMKASTNQNGTDQQAASLVQQQLGSNVEVQSNKVKTVTRTIHYEEQRTDKTLKPDDTQSVTFVPYYKKGQITIKYYDEDYKRYIPASVVPARDKTGYVGQKLNKGFIEYDITSIENIGYQRDGTTAVPDDLTFTESPQTYRINFIHDNRHVYPDHPGASVTPDTPNPANPANSLFMVLAQTNSDGTGDPTTFYAIVQNGSMTEHDLSAENVRGTLDQVTPPATLKGESLVDPTKTIPAYSVNLNSRDTEETVYYKKAEPATATIKYIDDTDSRTLAQDSAKGEVGTQIFFKNSVGTEIENYENQGYQYVTNSFKDNKYDSDNNKNQFEVHFKHQIKPVTDIDTVNETIHYVFADGSMAEPTHYASVNWTRTGRQDMTKVNERDKGITWDTTSAKSFSEVPSPELTGYTPDPTSIDAITVNFDDQDIDKTVTYNANTQNAKISYIDDTDNNKLLNSDSATGNYNTTIHFHNDVQSEINKYQNQGYQLVSNSFYNQKYQANDKLNQFEVHFIKTDNTQTAQIIYVDQNTQNYLKVINKTGKPNNQIDYSSAQDIANFEGNGYELVENGYDKNGTPKFDNDSHVDQTYYIVMKHGTEAKTDKKLGTLTVHYFGAGDQPPQDNTSQQFTFTHHFTVDKIDGHVVSDQGWTPSSHQYGYVQTPLITGYTSDKQQAGGQFVTYDNPDAWEEVVYTPIKAEKQRAIVTFVDDNTGITLMTKDLSGNAGTTDPYRTASDIKNYTDRGYVKVSDDYPVDGVVYDNDNETTQTFFVHLKHGTTSTSNDAKRTQTIIYTGMPDSLKPANNVQPLTFTHTIVKDSVDGHLISDSWTPAAQKYQDVVSPDVQGYTPNVSKVIGIEVNHQDPNRTIYVNYTPADNTQRAQIIYIDQTTGYTLHVYSATGQSNQPIDYHSAKDIKQFENNGFALVNNGYDPNGKAPSFDDDSDEDQTFTIVLEHTYQTINPKHPGKPGQPINQNPHSPKYPSGTDAKSLTIMGTQTIHYVDQNGKQMAPDDTSQHVQFTHEIVIDKVTGQTVADHGWTPASQTYGTVATPVVTGYTADRDIAGGQVATPSDPNREETVYYTAIPTDQKATITYIDDTLKKNLGSDQAQGKVDTTINFTHDVDNQIDNFIHQGYKLVSNGFDHQKFNHDDTKNQFEVHLAHDFKDVARQDPVHEIIHYVYADKTTAAPDATAEVHFVQHGQQDQVTKEVKWAPVKAAEFAAVKSPVIDGYTADQAEIAAVPVHFGDQNTVKTVTYHAGDQKATITYIDRTTGKTLKVLTEVGKANSTIPYQSKVDITGYEDLGYTLDDNQYDAQGIPSFDDDNYIDQNFNIYLKHTYQTINPKHPGKPGQPVDKNPNGPKYPSGTDAKSLTITGTQTIHYVDQNGKQIAPDDTSQHVQFTHEIVIDKVTGQQIADHGWTNAQTYQKVTTPPVKGYTADKAVAGGETVTYQQPNSQNIVHFTPINDTQKATIIYVDTMVGDRLFTQRETGKSNTPINYSSADELANLTKQGYVLVNNGYDPNGKAPSFDNQTEIDQTYYILLTHGTKDASQDSTVKETIHYVYADGKKAHDDVTVQKHFTQKGTQDLVTKQIVWQPVASQQFDRVVSPTITGYVPDQGLIPAITVNYGDKNIERTVIYLQGEQTATIRYIDDTTGNTMMTDNTVGKFNDSIKFANNVNDQINGFEKQGYAFVSNSFKNQKFQADNTKNIFEVHFKHRMEKVSRQDPVTETINYVYADGRQAHKPKVASVEITQYGTKDLVTSQIDWLPADPQQFKAVTSPTIEGYVPDVSEVPAIAVDFGQGDVVRTVTYRSNQQQAQIIYVDDTTGDQLKTVDENGTSGDTIPYTSKADLDDFLHENYALVNNGYDPAGKTPKFDNDTSLNQIFYIHLNHNVKSIQRQNTITETVHYVYADGKKAHDDVIAQKHFVQNGTEDLVTTDVAWQPVASQQFNSVKSPTIAGYTPDYKLVPAFTVNFGDKDINTTVTYTAGKQTATIIYVDRTTGHILNTLTEHGTSATTIPYSSANDLKNYQNSGYVLDENKYDPNGAPKFNSDENIDQTFYIYLKHGTTAIKQPSVVYETIHYVYQDGTPATKNYTAKKSFTRQGVKDLVTNEIKWQAVDPQNFASVESPKITGYIPDQLNVPVITVNYNSDDVDRIVTYAPAILQATIKYIDDNTRAVLSTDDGSGKYQQPIEFANDVNTQIKNYEGQGYKLVSNNFSGQNYQMDNAKNVFEVHLKHGMKQISRNSTVHETITYVYTDGSRAAAPVTAEKDFTQMGTEDQVTKHITWQPVASEHFTSVKSPEISGYVPDIVEVPAIDVNFGHDDIFKKVTYESLNQRAKITYIDQTTNQALQIVDKNGNANTVIPYTSHNDLQRYLDKGYHLVTNGYDPDGKTPSFDNDKNVDQNFIITLEHTYQTINPKHPGKPGQPINKDPNGPKYPFNTDTQSLTTTGTLVVHYVGAGKQTPKDQTRHVTFTHEIVIDKVTGKKVADHGWMPASQTYDTIKTPIISGYTADKDVAGGQVVTQDNPNREETVYYTAIPAEQTAKITYIDDTTGKTLTSDNGKGGKAGDLIVFNHDVNNQIDNYVHQGYKLVSNNFRSQNYQTDNTKNQFEVHLSHDIKDLTQGSIVKEVIHYIYADKTTAAPDATAEVHFVQHGQQDQVTKEVKWAPVKAAEFAAVKSPVIDGYTADQAEIVAVPVHFGDQDTVKTVTYHAGDQKATITYIDRTTGKTLTIRTEVGKANSTIPYQSKADIIGYEDLGYVLDDNQYDAQGTPSFDDDNYIDQNFNIYLKHTYQTINPKHPGKPGQPINKDPNGPKYPSDTDAQSLTITGTQTIHYVDQNGNPVAPDDTSQHVQFTHEIVIDKVTGQRIADHGWTNAQTYQKVKVPTVKGYTADKTVAGGETVTYKRPDSIAYVHYTPIEQQRAQVIYVDQSTGDYLKTVTKTGAAMTTIPYQSKDDLKGYLDAGYVLIKNGYDPVGKAPSFDNQTATDQIFYITLNHNTKETSRQDVVTETIHYIYADGKKAHDDVTVQKHFTQKGTQDLVTKQISWQPVASQQFTSVASPAIDGYHADQPVIPAVIVNYGSPDIVKTVTYTAGDQQATIIYVDDTTGNELNRISENGKSGKQIPYSSKQDLLSYEEQGYVLVTNGYDVNGIPSFDKDENINQIFYINLKHGTQSVTPNNPGNPKEPNIPGKPQHPTDYDPATLEKDVTRTIKYVVNGNHQVPDSIKQTVHFEQKGLYDKVTGEWITPLSWVVDHQVVKGVISPRIAGYRVVSVSGDTTDNQNVNAKTLGPEDSSYIITVTYDSASPTNPTTPTSPTSSTTPTNPTSPTSPTTPTSPMAPTNPTSPTTPTAPTSPVDDTNQPKITPHFVNSNVVHKPTTRMVSQPIDLQQVTTTNQGANVLPQTGNEEVISAAAFGLMGLAMAASIVAGTRKKRHE